MIRMLNQLFTMFTVLFGAGEKAARAIDNLATYGEEASQTFVDSERIKRAKQLKALEAQPIAQD